MLQVKLEKFEGPLSLLLQIIEKEELDVTEISLSKIADEYLNYIKSYVGGISPEEVADFLVVAAKLLLIKSRALLPYLFQEEEAEIEEFENQLLMYKEFVDAAKKIEKMIGRKKFMYIREFNRQAMLANMRVFSPPKNLNTEQMAAVFGELIAKASPPEKLEEETLEHKISIDDQIVHIQKTLLDRIKFSFNQLLSRARSKTEIIVSFLAVLELIKQNTVTVEQENLFDEIFLCRSSVLVESDFGVRVRAAE